MQNLREVIIRNKKVLIVFAALLLSAFIFRQAYITTSNPDLDIKSFQNTLDRKCAIAESGLDTIQSCVEYGNILKLNELTLNSSNENDISYFVYFKNNLVFWTDNTICVPKRIGDIDLNTPLVHLQNSYSLRLVRNSGLYTILSLIKIKNEYETDNEYLKTGYCQGFDIDPSVSLINGNKSDEYAVYSGSNYIFSLKTGKSVVYSYPVFFYLFIIAVIAIIAMIFYAVNNIYKWLLGKEKMTPLDFLISSSIVFLFLELCFLFNWPQELFQTELFSPIHYASGNIFSSLGHLLFFTIITAAEIVYFAVFGTLGNTTLRFIKSDNTKFLSITFVQIVSAVVFFVICEILKNLIYNSTFSVILFDAGSLSWPNIVFIVIVFLLMSSFIMIRHKSIILTSEEVKPFHLFIYDAIACLILLACTFWIFTPWTVLFYFIIICAIDAMSRKSPDKFFGITNQMLLSIIFVSFIVFFSISNLKNKQFEFYKTMAENLESSEFLDSNIFTEIMLDDLERQMMLDKNININSDDTGSKTGTEALKGPISDSILVQNGDSGADSLESASIEEFQDYIQKTYFRGFWNNYEISISQLPLSANAENSSKYRYLNRILSNAEKIKDTHFYITNEKYSSSEYIAKFSTDDRIFFIEFKSKTRINSYSYPVSLFSADDTPDITENTSVAKYRKGICVAQKGKYHYSYNERWLLNDNDTIPIDEQVEDRFIINTPNYCHYLYNGDNGDHIVITQKRFDNSSSTIFFWIYTFIICSLLLILLKVSLIITHMIKGERIRHAEGFVSKIQITFMLLLVASLLVVGAISSFYLVNQYTKRQNISLLNKTHYIQKYVQETFKKKSSLNTVAKEDVNFFLQDLANTYETDIHLFDDKGILISTSLPVLFNHNISAPYANPAILAKKGFLDIQTEHIGNLQYFASYAPVYNSSNKLLGYICVPSFFSYERLRNEVFNLLAITVSVYIIIMMFSVWLSFVVSKQLSKPLEQIKNKLASFQLKGRNEKLQYDRNDEIGKLVEQYNAMVDKLNESAEIMAKSERETAWKQMARQVTHEIKNPLTPMKLSIQMMQRIRQDCDVDRFYEYFDKSSKVLIEQIESLAAIATAFSDFAKMPEAKKERVNICDCVVSTADLFCNNEENVGVACDVNQESVFILADKQQLKQVFNNIIKNAIQSIPKGRTDGKVCISINVADKRITVIIKDNGSGVSSDIKDKIFTPNFTTKTSGMGLGLAIVKNIVTNNDGNIWFDTEEGHGTTFYIQFPLIP